MFGKRLNELTNLVENCSYSAADRLITASEALDMAHFLLYQVSKLEGIVYLVGNGGSSAIASHFCTDLLRTLGISSATFTDASTLTCFANDCGYINVFRHPLEKNLRPNDLLIAISSSGKSANIIEAVKVAKEKKVAVIGLSGFLPGNPLRKLGDLNFFLESEDYGLVETGHFFLLHTIIDLYPNKLRNWISADEKALAIDRS